MIGSPRPLVCIFDLDGCLADHSKRLVEVHQSRDWERYHESLENDPCNKQLAHLCRAIFLLNAVRVYIATGRPEKYRARTDAWLKKHDIPHHSLFMHPGTPQLLNSDFKQQVLKVVSAYYQIWFAVEDQPSVVAMWRRNNVLCLVPTETMEIPHEPIQGGIA